MSISQQQMATVHVVMEAISKYIAPDVREIAREELHSALQKAEHLFTPIPERDPEEVRQTALETIAAFAPRVNGDGL